MSGFEINAIKGMIEAILSTSITASKTPQKPEHQAKAKRTNFAPGSLFPPSTAPSLARAQAHASKQASATRKRNPRAQAGGVCQCDHPPASWAKRKKRATVVVLSCNAILATSPRRLAPR